jgi:type II secretory pathway pseudopilin PulG
MAEASTLRHIPQRNNHVRGFTYLSLIVMVAIVGLVTASAIKLGSVLQRSRAEQELLDIGAAFSDALKSYADATPQACRPSRHRCRTCSKIPVSRHAPPFAQDFCRSHDRKSGVGHCLPRR